MSNKQTITAEVNAILTCDIRQDAPDDLFTRGVDPEWYKTYYGPMDRDDIITHWASNAATNGVDDVSVLDGWADVPFGAVRFDIEDVEVTP